MTTVVAVLGGIAAAVGVLAAAFVVSFRTKFGPVQRAIRRLNRAFTNPRQLRTAGQPGAYAGVVHHVGRRSGTAYRTPVVAVVAGEDLVVALPYGPGADWVQNVFAAGSATIEHEGRTVAVARPRLIPRAAADPHFEAKERRSHRWFGVDDFLVLVEDPSAPGEVRSIGT